MLAYHPIGNHAIFKIVSEICDGTVDLLSGHRILNLGNEVEVEGEITALVIGQLLFNVKVNLEKVKPVKFTKLMQVQVIFFGTTVPRIAICVTVALDGPVKTSQDDVPRLRKIVRVNVGQRVVVKLINGIWIATGWLVSQLFILPNERNLSIRIVHQYRNPMKIRHSSTYSILSETVHADIEPKPENVLHLLLDQRVAVIQIWLLLDKLMKVELFSLHVPLPGGIAEERELKEN